MRSAIFTIEAREAKPPAPCRRATPSEDNFTGDKALTGRFLVERVGKKGSPVCVLVQFIMYPTEAVPTANLTSILRRASLLMMLLYSMEAKARGPPRSQY